MLSDILIMLTLKALATLASPGAELNHCKNTIKNATLLFLFVSDFSPFVNMVLG